MTDFPRRGLGWVEPTPDLDLALRLAGPQAAEVLDDVDPPDGADNTDLTMVVDQGPLGSCVANAIGQIIRGDMVLRTGYPFLEFPSRMWGYTLALAKQGTPGLDVGTNLGLCMETLAEKGFPPESAWEYNVGEFGQSPPPSAWRCAHDQRTPIGLAYHRITETGESRARVVQQALASRKLVAFGSPVTETFCSTQPPPIVHRPQPGEKIAGGHAQVWCGYWRGTAVPTKYKVVNSWGPGFGDGGYYWMDEDFVTWDETRDLWIVSKAPIYSEVRL